MNSEINMSEVTADVISDQISKVTESLTGKVKNQWVANIKKFETYIKKANEKYKTTKTLLYKNEAVLVKSIYVGTRLRQPKSRNHITDKDITNKLIAGEELLITATAGAGKSFLAKNIYLDLLASKERLPIMVELRHLNDSGLCILEHITDELNTLGADIDKNFVISLLKKGRFALILDGYDEISSEIRRKVNAELRDLKNRLANSSLLITSRPDEELEYFSDISVFEVLKLDKEQALELIRKLDYDPKAKSSFLKKLDDGLFEEHEDFLSNPLLLTIMLMTFANIAEIPTKMNVFYEHAFDVLFYKHDASKGIYKRKIHSNLEMDDFKDVTSSVAASGYIREKVSHSNSELLGYIRKAKKTYGLSKLVPEHFKKDLLSSVCLLVNDSNSYVYNHRSFQEYFAALFLVNTSIQEPLELYKRYLRRVYADNALILAYEMNQNAVESYFVLPMLKPLLEASQKGPLQLMKMLYIDMQLNWMGNKRSGRPIYSTSEPTESLRFLFFLLRVYEKSAGANYPTYKRCLTKKAYLDVVGYEADQIKIKLKSINSSQSLLLEKVGMFGYMEQLTRFFDWLSSNLEIKIERTADQALETWL